LDLVPQLRCGRKCLQGIACYEWLKKVIFFWAAQSRKITACYGGNSSLDAGFLLILDVPLKTR